MAGKIKQLYTPDEAAEILRLTRRTVYNYIKSGTIKGVKVGGRWRITAEEVARVAGQEGAEK